ncbi:hypothetical protein G7K_0008-t1 [Saitoella complicata NRRL Y-17804]|uniref:Uncharacterized protein n=1 Tax=Saitoella complicata (strain BCRC 22490 / CBS 7301 / JCM 7358 / NBRC 10748 / NRRL Y-17804) TaxID=698492 RepID=A0A0E9N7Q6_SAICN|nr:hypothetical protein G7K_0008-t1 [Saitoella complicata NRRL Y-17804]
MRATSNEQPTAVPIKRPPIKSLSLPFNLTHVGIIANDTHAWRINTAILLTPRGTSFTYGIYEGGRISKDS